MGESREKDCRNNMYRFYSVKWNVNGAGGVLSKVLVKIGIEQQSSETDWTLIGWERSLEQLNYDADIAFFGDSITSGGNFKEKFSEWEIINLGIPGDTLLGMTARVEMLASVKPEKIFIMGGINSLINNNSDRVYQQYEEMITSITKNVPKAMLYIESILPISKEKENDCTDNSDILEFNMRLKKLAEEKNLVYIDLFSLYELNGFMNPELTKDGLHLQPEAYEYWFEEIKPYIIEELHI